MAKFRKATPIRDNMGKIVIFASVPFLWLIAFWVHHSISSSAVRMAVSVIAGLAGLYIILSLFLIAVRPQRRKRRKFRRELRDRFIVRLLLGALLLCIGFVYAGSIVIWATDSAAGLNTLPRMIAGVKAAIAGLPILWPAVREWFSELELKTWHVVVCIIALWVLKALLFGKSEDSGYSSGSGTSGSSYSGGDYSSVYADLDYLHDIRKITDWHKTHDIDSYPDPEAPGPDPEAPGPDPEAPVDSRDLW